ncbi:kynureninase [Kitasatospora griseola]|uniref:Kynureninase n=1 Tax=Kitasatospora griseola TaxID=2064 RepID=A0A0D0PNA3_KITGR|nr:kynureninase [Kitasatospora griseola]KIQ61977.1 kynureninase [Kitasatospora griseola]
MTTHTAAPTREDCVARDAADPLHPLREHFDLPEGVLYLDGNSLGALPRRTPGHLAKVVAEEWGAGLIRSWNDAGWFHQPGRLGDRLGAHLLGAAAGQVVVCDSTSVNLFKVLGAALRLRPGRGALVAERHAFPTDLYIADGLTGLHPGARPVLVDSAAQLDAVLDADTAVVLLSHVDYRTGELLDMAAVTERIHRAGALAVWDLCHTAGALPIQLDAADVDFAVGCGYKYLNGGPGAPAFLYAAERHHAAARQPLTGWFGHARQFDFEPGYRPAEGITRFLTGTPPVLGLAALESSLDVWELADPAAVRAKSLELSDLFLELTADLDVEPVTPRQHERRGSQVALRHPEGHRIVQALIARGVIGDFRAPDLMRFGFTPLYLSRADVHDAATALREVLASGEWRQDRFARRGDVT